MCNLLDLPIDINNLIINNLEFEDILDVILVNKYFYINCYNELLISKRKYFKKKIPKHIYKLIENFNFKNIKYLDFKEEFIGLDYIDRITIDNMDSSIIFSIDQFNRPCLAIMMNVKKDNYNVDIVHTLFQRYTLQSNHWVFGTCYPTYGIYYQAVPTPEVLDRLKNLIEKKDINIDNYRISLSH